MAALPKELIVLAEQDRAAAARVVQEAGLQPR